MMLMSYAAKYGAAIVAQLLFAGVWVASQLMIPRLMVNVIDHGIMTGDMNTIVAQGLLMLLVTVINIAALLVSLLFLTRVTAGISRDLRADLFERIISWSKETRIRFSNSTLVTRTVNDVKQVSNFVDLTLRKIFTLTITVVGALLIAFSLDAKLAAVIVVIIPVVLVVGVALTTKALPHYAAIRKAVDTINQIFRENIRGIRVIKAFNKTGYEVKRFEAATNGAYEASRASETTMMLLSPLVLLFTNLLILVLLYLGGVRAEAGTISLGVLIALIEYATITLTNIQSFASIIAVVPRAKVSIQRINEVLATDEALLHCEVMVPEAKDGIHLSGVNFYYPQSRVATLHDIHLTLTCGETKAIIGSTGSGKTTLVQLLMRDYDAYDGTITINGYSVQGLPREDISAAVTVVPQTSFLFSGSVRDNLQIGNPDATDAEIWDVLDIVDMAAHFRASPDGLDTHIAQGAVNLSGGQQQRLTIARGLLRDSDFYVFDDCFSALDYATEKRVRLAIQERLADHGVLVVAQRVATVRHADEIVVLEQGHILDRGTHDSLLQESPVYREIVASQLKSDEGVLA